MAERSTRSVRFTVAVTPEVMDAIKAVAGRIGVSANVWAAFTLGSAVASHQALEERMSDEVAEMFTRMMAEAAEQGGGDD